MLLPLDNQLYEEICGWWKSYGWPVLPQNLLPKRGYVSFIGEKPIIAGFLYKDETADFGMVEWIVSNPESTKEERDQGFKELMEHILEEAKKLNVRFLMTTVNNERLIKRMEEVGFFQDTQNVIQMFKEV